MKRKFIIYFYVNGNFFVTADFTYILNKFGRKSLEVKWIYYIKLVGIVISKVLQLSGCIKMLYFRKKKLNWKLKLKNIKLKN